MTRRRLTTILISGVLAAGTTGCMLPDGGGGGGGGDQPCIDGQEGNDPRELSGTSFGTQTSRCIEPDGDVDVYDVIPTDPGSLTVVCTTGEADLVHVEIDRSIGSTVDFACGPGAPSETVELGDGETAQVTFSEGAAGNVDEGEGYRLDISFDSD
jgi:hypothetical protein